MTTREYRIAYARGWYAGSRGRWPDYAPPQPPHEMVRRLFAAAKDLSDHAAGLLQVVIPDDGPDGPFFALDQKLREVDGVFGEISAWLKAHGAEQ